MKESKLLTWWQPNFTEEDAKAVFDVVKSGFINEGEICKNLCDFVKNYTGVKHVITAPNGTLSLYLALKSLGIGNGDEVIIPALTFIATASAVVMTGAEPVFTDVSSEDCNILCEQIEPLITKKTKAIIPVHINGRKADLEQINKIAKENGLYVIEDAAEALGSKYNENFLGTISDVGIISLAPTKIITSGQGGLILTNNERIAENITKLKDHGRLSREWNHHPEIGYNFKFNDILAALALSQIKTLHSRIEKAVSDYNHYIKGLEKYKNVSFFKTNIESGMVPLWVDIVFNGNRGYLIEYMKQKNIILRPFWPVITKQKPYEKFKSAKIINADYISKHGLWLPSGLDKTNTDISRVIEGFNKFNL